MKTQFISIAIILSGFYTFGQSPVITDQNVYLLGDEVPISICDNVLNPGDAGADVTWDMSDLSEQEEQAFTFVAPDETPWGYQFTEANLCGVSWDDSYSFYHTSTSGVRVDGYTNYTNENQTDTAKIVMTDPEELIPLPLQFGDTQLDEFSGTTEALGFTIPFTGEIDFEADGYGTLILPNGTFQNVVRYHFTREQNNTFQGITTTQTKEQWGWMSADYRFWLLIMEVTNDGFSDQELIWYAKNPIPVSLSATNLKVENIAVFPNPARLGSQINIELQQSASTTIQWYDMTGRLVHQSNRYLQEGTNSISVPPVQSEGLYMLNIFDGKMHLVSRILLR